MTDIKLNLEVKYLVKDLDFCILLKTLVKMSVKI